MFTDEEFFLRYGQELNDDQITAVRTINGPVLLLAVPGSGKTTVLVRRLGYMLYVAGIYPANILTVTYTVAATKDMSRRFASVFGEQAAQCLEFRTINGVCSKIITCYGEMVGKKPFDLVTDDKVTGKIITDLYVKIIGDYPAESDIKNIKTLITYCKNMMLTDSEIEKYGKNEGIELLEIYKQYNATLKQNNLMDYDDQMLYAFSILQTAPALLQMYRERYRYICVDEAQDTSKIQHMIIAILAGYEGNLFMVGDEDQSIYGFRAAFPEALLNFEKNYQTAKVLVMNKNYRSSANIVESADKFIQKNFNRHEKHMCATRNKAADIKYITLKSRQAQYKYLLEMAKSNTAQTAILYRDNESILPLVDLLERENVSYRIKSTDLAFFSQRLVMDIVNTLSFAMDPTNAELFKRIYFKFHTYLKKTDALQMCTVAQQKQIPILDTIELEDVDLQKHIKSKVKSLRTHFKNMKIESPAKAINRITENMGYGDYLKENNMGTGKLFILEMLAKNEKTIPDFLERLNALRNILLTKQEDYNAQFILSTIHSSKGLEYDNVVIMDVINGVFPSNIIKDFKKASKQEKNECEEERRIFYVGITRAKDHLTILKYEHEPSVFIGELIGKKKEVTLKSKKSSAEGKLSDTNKEQSDTKDNGTLKSNKEETKPAVQKSEAESSEQLIKNHELKPKEKAEEKAEDTLKQETKSEKVPDNVPKKKPTARIKRSAIKKQMPIKGMHVKQNPTLNPIIQNDQEKEYVISGKNIPKTLRLGDKIQQDKYGSGTIINIEWDENEKPSKFMVQFDSGEQKAFLYPFAFIATIKMLEQMPTA